MITYLRAEPRQTTTHEFHEIAHRQGASAQWFLQLRQHLSPLQHGYPPHSLQKRTAARAGQRKVLCCGAWQRPRSWAAPPPASCRDSNLNEWTLEVSTSDHVSTSDLQHTCQHCASARMSSTLVQGDHQKHVCSWYDCISARSLLTLCFLL
jgi:hypothetical protein